MIREFIQHGGPLLSLMALGSGSSIPTAIEVLSTISVGLFSPTFSEDPARFTLTQLQSFAAIVFLSNSDQVLSSAGEVALEQYLASGGNLIGLHAATACLFEDQAFGTAVSLRVVNRARFRSLIVIHTIVWFMVRLSSCITTGYVYQIDVASNN